MGVSMAPATRRTAPAARSGSMRVGRLRRTKHVAKRPRGLLTVRGGSTLWRGAGGTKLLLHELGQLHGKQLHRLLHLCRRQHAGGTGTIAIRTPRRR